MAQKIYTILIAIFVLLGAVAVLTFFFIQPSGGDWYSYPAVSAATCLAGETYDEVWQECQFDLTCDSEVLCQEVDARYVAVLNDYSGRYFSKVATSSEKEIEVSVRSASSTNDTFTPLSIEKFLDLLLPASEREQIVSVVEDSDGVDGTLAYVEALGEGEEWLLAYDPADTYTSRQHFKNINELVATLVHEYAHVLMLNNTQVTHYPEEITVTECFEGEVLLPEGCALPDSYISAFVERFWSEDMSRRAREASSAGEEEDFAYEEYTRDPDEYVSEYAATNEIEDMAETFAHFVLMQKPAGVTLAEEKVLFFWQYPELLSLRNHMRAGVAVALSTSAQ